jgi:hypothetical protein
MIRNFLFMRRHMKACRELQRRAAMIRITRVT